MPRPPLAIGTYGEIYTKELAPGRWLARAQFRDPDGVTRPVKRHSTSRPKAVNALKNALKRRTATVRGGEFTPDMKISELAGKWLAEMRRLVDEGRRSPTTVDRYEYQWTKRIKRAFGELRARELDAANGGVSLVHDFLVAVAVDSSANAKMCRAVLSGMFAYAIPRKAMAINPVRDAGAIEVTTKRAKRGITAEEIMDFQRKLLADPAAMRWDLPDVTTLMAATGIRIGEVLALSWENVNLAAGTVAITHRMIRAKGRGLVRAEHTKRATGDRALELPSWAVTMLKRRKLASGGAAPVFATSTGDWQSPNSVDRVLLEVRTRAGYEWLTSHAYRRGVATILDNGGATARAVADQLGHAQVSMTQDVYLSRRTSNSGAVRILESVIDM